MKWLIRDVGGPLIVAIATVAGLIALFDVSWSITIPAAILVGAGWLLIDVGLYKKPIDPSTAPGGRLVIWVLSAITAVSALILAFNAGRTMQAEDPTYLFIAAPENGVVGFVYAAPDARATIMQNVSPGQTVSADCVVEAADGPWYRVIGGRGGGWISGQEFVAAPHTGQGNPPGCPE